MSVESGRDSYKVDVEEKKKRSKTVLVKYFVPCSKVERFLTC